MQRYAASTPSSDPRKITPKSFIGRSRMRDRRGSNPSVLSSDFASEETDSKLGDGSKHGGTAFTADFSDSADHGKGRWLTRLDNVVFVLLCATSFYYILIVPLQACFDWSSLDEASDNVIFVLNYVADAVSLSANGRRLY